MSEAIDRLGAPGDVDRQPPLAPTATSEPQAEPGPPSPRPGAATAARRRRLLVGGLTALLALPLAVAVAVQRSPRWYPSVDLAQIEMRVRDVGLAHPPLVGLGGRIVGYGTQGSHPGPISFYALAPLYRLFGSNAWALQVAGAGVNVVALGLAVWMGNRRWGARGAIATTALLALLMRFYGPQLLTVPWNPHFPILWWPVLLLAVWSVLCRDLKMLPVAVVAGTMCAQTHVPYIGLVGGLAALTAVALVTMAVWPVAWPRLAGTRLARSRLVASLAPPGGSQAGGTAPAGAQWHDITRWTAIAAGLAVVLWLPPVIQQLTNDPGNFSIIFDNFRHPAEPPLGMDAAWDLWLLRADPRGLVTVADRGLSTTPASVLLMAWLASVAAAAWLRHGKLLRLHLVTGAALLLGLISISRIFGLAWLYLTYWLSGTVVLTIGAIAATLAVAAGAGLDRLRRAQAGPARSPEAVASVEPGPPAGRTRPARPPWPAVVAPVLLAALVAVPVALVTADMTDAEPPDPQVSAALRTLAPATREALTSGDVPGGGADGTYVVTWTDPVDLGSTGFSLLLDLERAGFDARAGWSPMYELGVRRHRTIDPEDADAEVHVSVGDTDIAAWRARAGAIEVASYEPRSPATREEVRRIRREVVERLEAQGLSEVADEFEWSRMAAAIDVRTPYELTPMLERLAQIPEPVSVFVTEVGEADRPAGADDTTGTSQGDGALARREVQLR